MIYKFTEPGHTVCFVCSHVLNRERSILYVAHEQDDGFWQFLCGRDGHTDSDYKIISLKEAVGLDKSINDLFEMPLGVGAKRKTETGNWEPFKLNFKTFL